MLCLHYCNLGSASEPAQEFIQVGHEHLDCTNCCLLNVLSAMAYLDLLLHAFAADNEGQTSAVCQANKAAV